MVLIMTDVKKNNILQDDGLRLQRIRESPIKSEDNLLTIDWLEKGFLRLYEYMGGILYILGDDVEMGNSDNVALVAELTVTIDSEKRSVRLSRVFDEFGYELAHLMIRQLIHFADFYGYSLSLLDLTKGKRCA